MALDLYLHPRKTILDSLRAPDHAATPARQRAQRKALDALLARHPECTLVGDPLRGRVDGFMGELTVHPGYLHWCLHGEVDTDAVQALVEAFEADGWTCTDPQDAGFGSEARADKRLADWDELIGAEFVGLALQRDWGARVVLDFQFADGRPVRLDFMHFGACQLPELGTLLQARLVSVTHEAGKFDSVSMVFDNGQRLAVEGCVPNGGVIGAKPRRR
ncbi:MAG: hypothetical protein IPK27_22110 [Rhodanobacteraceae bacterium]|nr:hypothetical protein [Rhodanobacteraceae bacterium]